MFDLFLEEINSSLSALGGVRLPLDPSLAHCSSSKTGEPFQAHFGLFQAFVDGE